MKTSTMIVLAILGTFLLMSISVVTLAWRQASEIDTSWTHLEASVEDGDASACFEHQSELEVHYFNPLTKLAGVFFDIREEPSSYPCAELSTYGY